METSRQLSLIISKMKKIIIPGLILFSLGWTQTIQIFSPEERSTVPSGDVLVAASFYGIEDLVPERIRLYIDGKDISSAAMISEDMVAYSTISLTPGSHSVKIFINRGAGRPPMIKTWKFSVSGRGDTGEILTYAGKITSESRYYKYEFTELAVNQTGMNFRGNIYNLLDFRAKVNLTSEEDPLMQARNRFGLNLKYSRFLELNIGDANPKLTKLTLYGKRVRGYDVNLKLGLINFHYIDGEINRAVQQKDGVDGAYELDLNTISFVADDDTASAIVDTTINMTRLGYTFTQNIQAGRLSFGSGKYFQSGLSLVKVRDDINSVNRELKDARIQLTQDTLGIISDIYTFDELLGMERDHFKILLKDDSDWKGNAPKDNLVIGGDMGLYLDHKKILLEGELAYSLFNTNIWDGPLTLDALDTLMDADIDNQLMGTVGLEGFPDPADFEDYFIINQYITPLVPIDIRAFDDSSDADITIGEAVFSMPALAARARMKLNYFGNYLTVEASQVGPEFNSLANPFLVKNNREITFSDRIQLLKNRLLISLMYKHQDDDIVTTISNVTNQNTFNTNITYIPGTDWPTVNLSLRTLDRDNGISSVDTLFTQELIEVDSAVYDTNLVITGFSDSRDKTNSFTLNTTISYRVSLLDLDHSISATIARMNKKDEYNNRYLDSNFVDPSLLANIFNLSWNTTYDFPLKTNFTFTNSISEFSIGPKVDPNSRAKQTFTSFGLQGEYTILKLKLTVISGFNFTKGTGFTEVTRTGLKGGIKIKILDNLSARGQMEVRRNKTVDGGSTAILARANLTYTF